MTFTPIAAWILTFLLHSTVLSALALLCLRFLRGPAGKVFVPQRSMIATCGATALALVFFACAGPSIQTAAGPEEMTPFRSEETRLGGLEADVVPGESLNSSDASTSNESPLRVEDSWSRSSHKPGEGTPQGLPHVSRHVKMNLNAVGSLHIVETGRHRNVEHADLLWAAEALGGAQTEEQLPISDGALLIVVHKDTPFRAVQQIMEMCASQDVQIWRIFVRTEEGNTWTDLSLPVDPGILPEEVEELEDGSDTQSNASTMQDPVPVTLEISRAQDGEVFFAANGETLSFSQWTIQHEASHASQKGPKVFLLDPLAPGHEHTPTKELIVHCDPEVPMGKILPAFGVWTTHGVKLMFMASMPQAR